MGGAEVRKSSPARMIRPPELLPVTVTTNGTIKLTSFDRGCVKVPVTVLLVFEHMGREATDKIKRALSQALVHYYPFAGRIIISSSGAVDGDEFSIRCTGDGVEFLTASMDCSLKEAKILDESSCGKINPLRNELAILYPFGSYGSEDDPLLSVQVTEFSCGGLVLGVSWSHAIAAAAGMAQFLAAVGNPAYLSFASNMRKYVGAKDGYYGNCGADRLISGATRSSVAEAGFLDLIKMIKRAKDQLPDNDQLMQGLRDRYDLMHVTSWRNVGFEQVDFGGGAPARVMFHGREGGTPPVPICIMNPACKGMDGVNLLLPCSVFEVVIAVLWRCHICATMSNKNPVNPVYLSFATDMRKYVGAKDGYYGNCNVDRLLVVPTRSAAAEAAVLDLIRMIKRAKDQLPDTVKKGNHDHLMMQQGLVIGMI
nr:unnamed protein product [Digitaria exilis]